VSGGPAAQQKAPDRKPASGLKSTNELSQLVDRFGKILHESVEASDCGSNPLGAFSARGEEQRLREDAAGTVAVVHAATRVALRR